eukprot:31043-Pelagococcus_subviridis.AAC.2
MRSLCVNGEHTKCTYAGGSFSTRSSSRAIVRASSKALSSNSNAFAVPRKQFRAIWSHRIIFAIGPCGHLSQSSCAFRSPLAVASIVAANLAQLASALVPAYHCVRALPFIHDASQRRCAAPSSKHARSSNQNEMTSRTVHKPSPLARFQSLAIRSCFSLEGSSVGLVATARGESGATRRAPRTTRGERRSRAGGRSAFENMRRAATNAARAGTTN